MDPESTVDWSRSGLPNRRTGAGGARCSQPRDCRPALGIVCSSRRPSCSTSRRSPTSASWLAPWRSPNAGATVRLRRGRKAHADAMNFKADRRFELGYSLGPAFGCNIAAFVSGIAIGSRRSTASRSRRLSLRAPAARLPALTPPRLRSSEVDISQAAGRVPMHGASLKEEGVRYARIRPLYLAAPPATLRCASSCHRSFTTYLRDAMEIRPETAIGMSLIRTLAFHRRMDRCREGAGGEGHGDHAVDLAGRQYWYLMS